MTPFEVVEEDKQRANFLGKLKAAENWRGSETAVLPRPAMPLTPLARPSKRRVGAQVKRNLGIETTLPGLDPSVDCMERMSLEKSPPDPRSITVLVGNSPQILGSVAQALLPLRLHSAERQGTGL